MKKIFTALTILLSACLLAVNPMCIPTDEGTISLSVCPVLQDAVNAVPNGGTVIIPRGIWEGDVVVPEGKYVHIEGVSPAMIGQSPVLGSSQWDYLLESYPDTFLNGSILRGHITATADASKLSITNIIMIGHGEGVAIDIAGVYGGRFENVDIGNYVTGINAQGVYRLTLDRMQIAGVGTGLVIRNGNLNRLRDIDISNCTLGADLKGEILWHGGSVQTCTDGIKVFQTAGYMGQIHFEQISNVALDWDGSGGKLDPNYYATNSGKVIIRGYNNILDVGWGVNTEFVYPRSQYNFATVYGPYTAGGWQDRIQTIRNIGTVSTQYVDEHKGQVYYPDGVVIKSGDGKFYRLTVTNGVLGIIEVK